MVKRSCNIESFTTFYCGKKGCNAYERSFSAFEPNLRISGKVPSDIRVLILNGENDTQTPVQRALLLQQTLTDRFSRLNWRRCWHMVQVSQH